MKDQLVDTSKFLSYVLRHHPESVGIRLDKEGWAEISALIAAAGRMRRRLDHALIEEVVRTSDKKRFAMSDDGLRIRAVQGHSTASVQLTHRALVPPPQLFHGTAAHNLDAIREQGLRPGERHHVHLSGDYPTAMAVGKRHGKPVVLRVDAGAMHGAGFAFYQADNGVWLTAEVPPRFLDGFGSD